MDSYMHREIAPLREALWTVGTFVRLEPCVSHKMSHQSTFLRVLLLAESASKNAACSVLHAYMVVQRDL